MSVIEIQIMQKSRMLLIMAAFVLFSAGIGFVNGQMAIALEDDTSVTTVIDTPEPPEPTTNSLAYLIAFSTFIVSGVFYSASGWIKKIRRKLAGDAVPLDYKKMGKTVAIGVILGIGAFIYSTWDGDTIAVGTAQEFFIQVGINTSVILLVDKWILGRSETIPAPVESDEFSPDDIPDEVPPGKGDGQS